MARPSVEMERKQQILTSTCAVIAHGGIRSLRVMDVARRAQLSPGIVHYYFDNKRDLIRAAFEHNFAHSLERRAAIFESDGEPLLKLRALVDAYLPADEETIEAWRIWAELWVEGIHDPELQDLNDRAYGEWRRIITSLLRDAHQAGEISQDDPAQLADLLVAALDGLAVQVLVGSTAITLERMRATCQRFINLLAA